MHKAFIGVQDRSLQYQTLVGRDSYGAHAGNPALAALYLSVRPGGSVAVSFTDNDGSDWDAGVISVGRGLYNGLHYRSR